MINVLKWFIMLMLIRLCNNGIIFWGCSTAALNTVFVAQKRLVWAMAGGRYWPSSVRLD
jgi:hypothetical protein